VRGKRYHNARNMRDSRQVRCMPYITRKSQKKIMRHIAITVTGRQSGGIGGEARMARPVGLAQRLSRQRIAVARIDAETRAEFNQKQSADLQIKQRRRAALRFKPTEIPPY